MILALPPASFFIRMVQEFNCMHRFLEASVKSLRRHVLSFFLSTMHVMENTITSSNGASSGSSFIEEGAADPVEGIKLICFVVIF